MINSSELAKKLDDNFTYETYFRLDQSKDAVFVIGVGSDTDDNMRAYFASDGLWIFKRYDSTGFAYWQAPSAKIEVGKYYHLIIKFEENKLPVAYLNGVKCETKHSGGTYPTSFVPYSADKIENSKVHILNYTCGSGSTRPTATWAMSSFYEGVADAYDVYKMYESAKAKFENYGVTFKNASEESVTAENVADTNKVKASVTVTSSLTEPTVILAKYNGGKLTEIKFASKKGGANDEYVFETDLVDFSAGDTLKVLCWSDLGSLSPITAEDSTLTK